MDYLFSLSDLGAELNKKKNNSLNIISQYDSQEIAKKRYPRISRFNLF